MAVTNYQYQIIWLAVLTNLVSEGGKGRDRPA